MKLIQSNQDENNESGPKDTPNEVSTTLLYTTPNISHHCPFYKNGCLKHGLGEEEPLVMIRGVNDTLILVSYSGSA